MWFYMWYNTTLEDGNSPFNLKHKIRDENTFRLYERQVAIAFTQYVASCYHK